MDSLGWVRAVRPGTIFVKQHVDLGKPVDNNVDPKTMDNSSIDGCMAACAGVTPVVVAAPLASLPQPIDPSKITPPNVEFVIPAAAPTLPAFDAAAIDLDQDGSPAGDDCDDDDARRAGWAASPSISRASARNTRAASRRVRRMRWIRRRTSTSAIYSPVVAPNAPAR